MEVETDIILPENLYKDGIPIAKYIIPNCGREKNLNVVLTNASGFGGLHAAMILKKYID